MEWRSSAWTIQTWCRVEGRYGTQELRGVWLTADEVLANLWLSDDRLYSAGVERSGGAAVSRLVQQPIDW